MGEGVEEFTHLIPPDFLLKQTPLSKISEEYGVVEYQLQLALRSPSCEVENIWFISNPHVTLQFEKRTNVCTLLPHLSLSLLTLHSHSLFTYDHLQSLISTRSDSDPSSLFLHSHHVTVISMRTHRTHASHQHIHTQHAATRTTLPFPPVNALCRVTSYWTHGWTPHASQNTTPFLICASVVSNFPSLV